MSYQFIQTQADLTSLLYETRSDDWLAFDTEFISEGKYRAELCLIQVAGPSGLSLIDAPKVGDLTPFWERLCDSHLTVIAHSCRSEMEFCFRAIGRIPNRLFDIQVAAGLVGLDYPAGFKKLGEEILGIEIPKGETRTDWRRRPLSLLQVEYALNDVYYLEAMTAKLRQMLAETGRSAWFEEEMRSYLARLCASFVDDRWLRISGCSGLGRLERAIVRELWRWRDQKASVGNRQPSRFLRDDLIVELAKRKTSEPDRIAALRGLARRADLESLKTELSAAIDRALSLPPEALPEAAVQNSYPSYQVAVQFLMTVLHNAARRSGVSIHLLASPQDARDFVAFRAGTLPAGSVSRLDAGWRRELLDGLLDDALAGKIAIRLDEPTRDDPIDLIHLEQK